MYDFGEIVTDHKMRVMIFSAVLSETFLMLRRIHDVCSKMYIVLAGMYLLFLSEVNGN
jgi:hypothetical protein